MNKEKQIEEIANDLNILDCLQHNPNYSINYQYAMGLHSLGYRKASEIFEEIEKALNRKIARSKPQFEKLHRNEKDLSIWGYKDMGYFQGIISTCEDIQGIIAELKKKYTESEKDDG